MILDNIRQACEAKNMNFTQLEKLAGLGNGTIGKWERVSPRLNSLCAVAKVLEIPVESLIEKEK